MVLSRSMRTSKRVTLILISYCLVMICYLALYSDHSAQDDKKLKLKESRSNEVLQVVTSTEIRRDAVKSYIDIEKSKVFTREYTYEHLLNPKFPLAGGLKFPMPGYKLGSLRKNADIVIGITTVRRDGGDYLIDTVDSLLRNRVDKETNIKIIVYIGDINQTYVQERCDQIFESFKNQIHFGEIEVIRPPDNYYPNWEASLTKTLNDSLERVKWRSKQNLDQIFVMMYAYNLGSSYYLMMEDDVTSKPGYDKKIFQAIDKLKDHNWFLISFCGLGAIGKLFRRATLPSYASFLHTFWNKKPLDWLQIDYVKSAYCSHDQTEEGCFKIRMAKMVGISPALFQHTGTFSSLKGKIQKLQDKTYNNSARPS